jgi:hypothetical protein
MSGWISLWKGQQQARAAPSNRPFQATPTRHRIHRVPNAHACVPVAMDHDAVKEGVEELVNFLGP